MLFKSGIDTLVQHSENLSELYTPLVPHNKERLYVRLDSPIAKPNSSWFQNLAPANQVLINLVDFYRSDNRGHSPLIWDAGVIKANLENGYAKAVRKAFKFPNEKPPLSNEDDKTLTYNIYYDLTEVRAFAADFEVLKDLDFAFAFGVSTKLNLFARPSKNKTDKFAKMNALGFKPTHAVAYAANCDSINAEGLLESLSVLFMADVSGRTPGVELVSLQELGFEEIIGVKLSGETSREQFRNEMDLRYSVLVEAEVISQVSEFYKRKTVGSALKRALENPKLPKMKFPFLQRFLQRNSEF